MNRMFFAFLFAALGVFLIPDISFAGGGIQITFSFGVGASGGIGDSICEIVGWFDGRSSGGDGAIGKAVASLAVIFLGIGAFFGKVTWGMALMVAAGIVAIFGANDIVHAITNGYSGGCGS